VCVPGKAPAGMARNLGSPRAHPPVMGTSASRANGNSASPALEVIEPLLRFVLLSSERTLERVRQDSSFTEKQEPHPALVLVVRSGHEISDETGSCSPRQAGAASSWFRARQGRVQPIVVSVPTRMWECLHFFPSGLVRMVAFGRPGGWGFR
jgi:hypothetical protein